MKTKNYSGLNHKTFKLRQQFLVEIDYSDRLDASAKEFLSKFNREWIGGGLDNPEAIHNTIELKRDCWCRNYDNQNSDFFLVQRMKAKRKGLIDPPPTPPPLKHFTPEELVAFAASRGLPLLLTSKEKK